MFPIATDILDVDIDDNHYIYLNSKKQIAFSRCIKTGELELIDHVDGQAPSKVAVGGQYVYVITENNQLYTLHKNIKFEPKMFNFAQSNVFYPQTKLNEYILQNNLTVILTDQIKKISAIGESVALLLSNGELFTAGNNACGYLAIPKEYLDMKSTVVHSSFQKVNVLNKNAVDSNGNFIRISIK